MSEKRFQKTRIVDKWGGIYDSETDKVLSVNDVEHKLNEQQEIIQRMKHSLNTIYKAFEEHYGYDMRNAVWLIDELSYDEIADELHIAETDSKNRKEASMYWKKKCDEQQATIRKLQDLCGESDGENAKLRIENEQLKKELLRIKKTVSSIQKEINNYYNEVCSNE